MSGRESLTSSPCQPRSSSQCQGCWYFRFLTTWDWEEDGTGDGWTLGFGYSSVVDYVLNTYKTLVLIPRTKQNPQ